MHLTLGKLQHYIEKYDLIRWVSMLFLDGSLINFHLCYICREILFDGKTFFLLYLKPFSFSNWAMKLRILTRPLVISSLFSRKSNVIFQFNRNILIFRAFNFMNIYFSYRLSAKLTRFSRFKTTQISIHRITLYLIFSDHKSNDSIVFLCLKKIRKNISFGIFLSLIFHRIIKYQSV